MAADLVSAGLCDCGNPRGKPGVVAGKAVRRACGIFEAAADGRLYHPSCAAAKRPSEGADGGAARDVRAVRAAGAWLPAGVRRAVEAKGLCIAAAFGDGRRIRDSEVRVFLRGRRKRDRAGGADSAGTSESRRGFRHLRSEHPSAGAEKQDAAANSEAAVADGPAERRASSSGSDRRQSPWKKGARR